MIAQHKTNKQREAFCKLAQTKGVDAAAAAAQVSRTSIYNWLAAFGYPIPPDRRERIPKPDRPKCKACGQTVRGATA